MSTERSRATRTSGGQGPRPARSAHAAARPAAARSATTRSAPRHATPARSRPAPRRAAPPRAARSGRCLRSLLAIGLLVGLAALAFVALRPQVQDAVDTIRLPLEHTELIREQSREKGLDPALVAAVIYAESRFRDNQESSAGAMGLMQVTPETARDIARESGANTFEIGDLHTADVNIRYGTWRLRDMLQRFDGNVALAAAGYNAGPGNAKKWQAQALAEGRPFRVSGIPFPETRNYVEKVLRAQKDYRQTYARELGLG